MKPVSSREGVCGGGHIPWLGLRGLTGGHGEKIKVPVGPQTAAVVGLCPLPLPSLAPHPISVGPGEGSRNLKGSECAGVCCHFGLIAPLFSTFWSTALCMCLASQNFFISFSLSLPCLYFPGLRVRWWTVRCNCGFNEQLWVSPYFQLALPSSYCWPLGPPRVFLGFCPFRFCPPCSQPPRIHPLAPSCALQAPFRSKLVESLHSC